MRAVQFNEYGPPGVVHVAEAEAPHAGPGTIRIAVRASGVSVGGDLHPLRDAAGHGADDVPVPDRIRRRGCGRRGRRRRHRRERRRRGVRHDDMAARGANADYAVLAAWAPKPAAWSWEEAGGAAGSVETATRVLDRLAVGAGQTVLVQGAAGGVGTVAVQLAVARGATVIGTASEHNHDFLRSLGASRRRTAPGLVERVRALAPGGVDAVFDCARRGAARPHRHRRRPGPRGDDRRLRRGGPRRTHVPRRPGRRPGAASAPPTPWRCTASPSRSARRAGPAAGAGRGGVPAHRGRGRARTEREPPRPRKDRPGALTSAVTGAYADCRFADWRPPESPDPPQVTARCDRRFR